MESGVGSQSTHPYRRALDRLRRDLSPTLDALDRAAADPWELDGLAEELSALQRALQASFERSVGIDLDPWHDAEREQLELALLAASVETADIAEALAETGPTGAVALVWEWRVALFAVRLALRELERPEPEPLTGSAVPNQELVPLLLLAAGVAGVLGGALASLWPIWLCGLLLVALSTTLSHRHP